MPVTLQRVGIVLLAIGLAVLPCLAQQSGNEPKPAPAPASPPQKPINPRVPPPPPPDPLAAQPESKPAEQPAMKPIVAPAPPAAPQPLEPPEPPVWLPERVEISAGTRIPVVLDTPLSTRITKKGDLVTFRTSDPIRVHDSLELPPETAFTGHVVEVARPGAFGKTGKLRVIVDQIKLDSGGSAVAVARLDSPDLRGNQLSADNSRAADLYNLASYTLQGTLLGSAIGGGKGAGIGAGAGAAIAVAIMASRRGPDLYLEPGMPFVVVLDKSIALSGKSVYRAQQAYSRARGTSVSSTPRSGCPAPTPPRPTSSATRPA